MTNTALFTVSLFAAIFFVSVALIAAKIFAPHSWNPVKGQAYECGIPTRGSSWMQFKVGYYLFAILYLVFDMETVLLFPWATVMKDLGADGLGCVAFFVFILTLGLLYAWRKGVLIWK
jgi:NADH-quinone oxidoreductase subunit A